MIVSKKKTKALIINFTKNSQFTTRLQLENENIDIVDSMKILGTTVTSDLTWEENCTNIIKKVNMRMELIRQAKSFGATQKELVHLWITYCRNILEQSCIVWHPSLTKKKTLMT